MKISNEYGWKFTNKNDGSFTMKNSVLNSRLYFPLCNNRLKSYVTPELKGDILLDYNRYLTIPKSTEDLHHCKDGRNFWLNIEGRGIWSCTGTSAEYRLKKIRGEDYEDLEINAGIGWIKIIRTSREYKVRAEITIFVPSNDDTVELIKVRIDNLNAEKIKITPFYAIPIYARSIQNLRDHRDVSTLCNRLIPNPYGVVVKPFMVHDEKKCYQNSTSYVVIGFTAEGQRAVGGWGQMFDYIGDNGSLETPEAVYMNKEAIKFHDMDQTGEEAVGAIKFQDIELNQGESKEFIIIEGITDNEKDIEQWAAVRYNSAEKFNKTLKETKKYWQKYVSSVSFGFSDDNLNKFLKWVNYQPFLRKVFGSSYLPDFGYGTGKRYWRELWQDLLAIIIADPYSTKQDIMNNFNGVKLDGSNATLVGDNPGEFAHRSNLGRTWSDHGVWPYFTTRLYMDLTGDLDILLEKAPYYKDNITRRGRSTDPMWTLEYGFKQKTVSGEIYYGTVLEHLLIQHITSFFNVGIHNITLLEAGDWDDTMDMARENGETVQFTAFYAANMLGICECLKALKLKGIKNIKIFKEMLPLLDSLPGQEKVDYSDYKQKRSRLRLYYDALDKGITGEMAIVSIEDLVLDLEQKAWFAIDLVNSQEYISAHGEFKFYNAYYTDEFKRLSGENKYGTVNISLTPQAYLMVLGISGQERAKEIHRSVNKYLRNEFGGYILRSDHKDMHLIDVMGRGFGLAFKTRENGGQYNHMVVKYMNGLYSNNLVKEGYEVFSTLTRLCMDSIQCRIFPGIPASIDSKSARGSYNYLTGSASWLIFNIITEIMGIKANLGDLNIMPKLVKEQFENKDEITVDFIYLKKKVKIVVRNRQKLDWNEYKLGVVRFNGYELNKKYYSEDCLSVRITKKFLEENMKPENIIEIEFIRK